LETSFFYLFKKNIRVVVCGRNFFSFFIIAPFCQEVLAHVRHRISGANEVDIHEKKEGGVNIFL
jgi:hypothetical protein